MSRFWDAYFKVKMWFVSWKCFFTGHIWMSGYPEMYQAPYCDRCWQDWPEDKVIFSDIKEDIRWWFIDLVEKLIGLP
jgi:hypothetical protein